VRIIEKIKNAPKGVLCMRFARPKSPHRVYV
jgi:hypothetical protein